MTTGFVGLLYIADSRENHLNLRTSRSAIDIYIECAALCAASFRHFGVEWTLVTNDAQQLEERRAALKLPPFSIREERFSLDVPAGIDFYAAHFKIELIAALGSGAFGPRVGLIDIDTVLLSPFPTTMETLPLVGYDITDTEVADFGADTVAATLALIADAPQAPCWWGGEFLVGEAAAFARLSTAIERVWPRYVANRRRSHHQGDEAAVTAALASLAAQGTSVHDGGRLHAVARWWSARTRTRHASLATAMKASLLHLPADKPFLARQARRSFDPAAFRRRYRRHAMLKSYTRAMFGLLDRIRGRPPKMAPRLR